KITGSLEPSFSTLSFSLEFLDSSFLIGLPVSTVLFAGKNLREFSKEIQIFFAKKEAILLDKPAPNVCSYMTTGILIILPTRIIGIDIYPPNERISWGL